MLVVAVIASLVVAAHGHGAVVNPPCVIRSTEPHPHARAAAQPAHAVSPAVWFVSQAPQRCGPQLEALERRCSRPATECRVGHGLVPGAWRRRQTLWSQRPSMLLYATALMLLRSSLPVPLKRCRGVRPYAGFSNGCAVGCDACDGSSRGPIPSSYKATTVPPTGIGRNKVGPNGVVCKSSNGVEPTICDPALRTINQNATCGGEDDWYYFSPWRARTVCTEALAPLAAHRGPTRTHVQHRTFANDVWLTCDLYADVQRELLQ